MQHTRLNVNGMQFSALLVVDGELQVVAAFYVEHEDEQSIRKIQGSNLQSVEPTMEGYRSIVITDKDIAERNV